MFDYRVSSLHWKNAMGSGKCPCRCWDNPYKPAYYDVAIHTKSIQGYGDPLVELIVVWCDECGEHQEFEIDDGSTRVSDIKI